MSVRMSLVFIIPHTLHRRKKKGVTSVIAQKRQNYSAEKMVFIVLFRKRLISFILSVETIIIMRELYSALRRLFAEYKSPN